MSQPPSTTDAADKEHSPDDTSETQGNGPSEATPGVNTSDEDASQYVTGIKLYTVIAGLTMVAFLMMLDSTIVTTALPRITSTFDSVKDIGWYGSTYLIATCALQPSTGKLYQFYKSKIVFISAVVIFELGSLICALSVSSTMFILGRAVAGCGAAGVLNGAFSIIAAAAPLDQRPKLMGIMIGISAVGILSGPIIGGALTQHASWRWCFYLNLPIGGITVTTLSFIQIPDAKVGSKPGSKLSIKQKLDRLDLIGFVIFAPAVAMLLLALQWGGATYPWNSATIIGLFCGAGATFLVFLGWEYYRKENAMAPLSLFRNRVVASAAICTLMSQGGVMVCFYYLPTWFQVVKNLGPTASGVRTLPSVGSMALGTSLAGFLVTRIGYYTPFIIAGAIGGAIAAGLLTTLTPSSGTAAWVCYQLLLGFSQGILRQQPLTAVQAVIPKDKLSMAISIVTFSQMFGASIFVSFGQTAFANTLKTKLKTDAPGVDPSIILEAGATDFRSLVPASSVPGILVAYNRALTTVFYLGVGASCATFVAAFGLKWINIKKKKDGARSPPKDEEPQIESEKEKRNDPENAV